MKIRTAFIGFAWFAFFSLALCLLLEFGAGAAGLTWAAVNEVTLSEYSPKDLSLVAQVHAARIFTDYERRGFFRIGLLPIPVVENVQIQIQSAECLTNALFALHDWNQPAPGVRRLELRNVEIILIGEKQPRLSAAGARVGQDGVLELSMVSVFNATGRQTSIPKAALQVAGSSAGWLRWNVDGHPQDIFPFKPTSDKTP